MGELHEIEQDALGVLLTVMIVTPAMAQAPVTGVDDPESLYTTTWFDMWRIEDGKADEHWDPSREGPT